MGRKVLVMMAIHWMLHWLLLAGPATFLGFDFAQTDEQSRWRVINDNVMGGVSKGRLVKKEASVLFEGQLSLANNGGFASVRSSLGEYDLSSFDGVEIECRGSGGAFALMLENQSLWYRPYFLGDFFPTDEWQILRIPFSAFDEYVIGKKKSTAINHDFLSTVIRVGIFKGDKDTRPFQLEMRSIQFYRKY